MEEAQDAAQVPADDAVNVEIQAPANHADNAEAPVEDAAAPVPIQDAQAP